MDRKKDAILKATAALTENYKNEELFMPKNGRSLPSRAVIIDVVKELRAVIFPVIQHRLFCLFFRESMKFPERIPKWGSNVRIQRRPIFYCNSKLRKRIQHTIDDALFRFRNRPIKIQKYILIHISSSGTE